MVYACEVYCGLSHVTSPVHSVADTGGGGGVPGVVTPPSGPSMNIIISRALFMNIILYHVSFCQQFARDETINVNFGIFPSGGSRGGGSRVSGPLPRT